MENCINPFYTLKCYARHEIQTYLKGKEKLDLRDAGWKKFNHSFDINYAVIIDYLEYVLFEDMESKGKSADLMQAMDAINSRFGNGVIRLAAAGTQQEWRMRSSSVPISSPKMPSSGNLALIALRIAASASRSAMVTGEASAFSSGV